MKLKAITNKYVLLCEGQHDSAFFSSLISARNLPKFDVCSVNYAIGVNRGGNTRFDEALDALVSLPGFQNVEKIVVVADNDLSPNDSFAEIVAQINTTAPIIGPPASRFVAPAAPQVKAGNSPATIVLMIPWTGVVGSLDTICFHAARKANPHLAICIDALVNCSGANSWPSTKQDKLKLRTILSVGLPTKPQVSPTYIWSEAPALVPLSDPIFDDIANFLDSVPNL